YEKARAQHGQQRAKPVLSIAEARRRRTPIEWNVADISKPEFLGLRVLASDSGSRITDHSSGNDHTPVASNGEPFLYSRSSITLSDLVPFIDWSPFFHTWE